MTRQDAQLREHVRCRLVAQIRRVRAGTGASAVSTPRICRRDDGYGSWLYVCGNPLLESQPRQKGARNPGRAGCLRGS
jgi:hypothetical protein